MSESHGTVLILKHHEYLERVAKYVKQQVREKSLDLLGEDLSEDDKFVGLRIKEEENEIIWHDYGHHGTHLDFNSISESVIKEFPDVEMERQGWWGQEVWNYVIADGKWQEYTLWKFVAYIDGKGEEVQLEYKEPKDGRTEEERHEERDNMCKEMAERLSRLHPGVEIAVYAYDWYMIYTTVDEFYRAKDGCAVKEWGDRGLSGIMPYFDVLEWVECIGHVLLHPMEFAAELIRRAREGEDYCPAIAAEMILDGDTAKYFSLIEPADKKWLMELVEEHEDIGAIYCLLHGMHHKYNYWNETFVDEDTHEEVTLLRYDLIDGSVFEKNEGEEERLVQIILEEKQYYTAEEIMKVYKVVPDHLELLHICVDKGDKNAAYQMYEKFYYGDEIHGIFINRKKAMEYYDLAGDIPYKDEWDGEDQQGEEYLSNFEYILSGNATTLNGVEELINTLCKKFGIPEYKEAGLGMFVPQPMLMKVLVGSDSEKYCGNILYMNRNAPDCLSITTESEQGEPLLYAFRQCFENLNVEFKRID